MIGRLTGKVVAKNPPEILLDVGGVGYEILCPLSTFYQLSDSKNLTLQTHLHITDNSQTLYGFIYQDEKTMFRELIKIGGVGPKVALAILSSRDVASLVRCIEDADDALLAETPGIGKKTAQKLIVELKDRLKKIPLKVAAATQSAAGKNIKEAAAALQALGFKAQEAEAMLAKLDPSLGAEVLIRSALKNK